MTESLRRGAGRLLYNGDEGSLVLSTDGTFLLSDIQDGSALPLPSCSPSKVTMPQQR